jgi:acyl-[acyl-carrier-protein]-phospholipid O-acyltransferase/long-chain-fatty-acid--[acyl-carrier-protein] ligase
VADQIGENVAALEQAANRKNIIGFSGLAAAQFLGAFNDNAIRWFLIALAMQQIHDQREENKIMAVATVAFLLPYILFSMHAGSLADHYSKRNVLMVAKAAESAVMLFCMVGLFLGASFTVTMAWLLVGLFLMGAQSTYYSPPKFGILPEMLPEKFLSWGNGIFEMTGMLAIILGTVLGAECVGFFKDNLYLAPGVFAVLAALGLVATWFVPRVPAASPLSTAALNPFRALRNYTKRLAASRILLLTVMCIILIWSLGVLFQLTMAKYATDSLGFKERHMAWPMAIAAVGVGIGTMLAGLLSGKTIEVGLMPIGSFGMAVSSILLFFSPGNFAFTCAAIISLGASAGLFIVPAHAMLQEESPVEYKGGVWAATNLIQTFGMLAAAGSFAFLLNVLELTPAQLFLYGGLGVLVFTLLFMILLPESLGRLAAWLRIYLVRRVHVHGQNNVPVQGPVLFLVRGEPTKYFYALLAGTRRFVRFVVPDEYVRPPLIGFMARRLGAIRFGPSGAGGSPEEATAAHVRDALSRGDSVAVYATADGTVSLSPRTVADLLKTIPVPVVPVTLKKKRRTFTLLFETPWDRTDTAEALLERLAA